MMKKKIPDLKILVFVCEPIKRLLSHINMHYKFPKKRAKYWGANSTLQDVWDIAGKCYLFCHESKMSLICFFPLIDLMQKV
jgi:hypothetical protein